MARYKTTDKEQDNLFISLKLSEQIILGTHMGTVEPVFANIGTHKGMDHFTLRAILDTKVLCMA